MSLIFLETTIPPIYSSYTGGLSSNSLLFSRPGDTIQRQFYSQPIQVYVHTAGTYTFTSNSTIDTRGYLYHIYFNQYNTTENLLTDNDDSGGQFQFRIQVYLQAGATYILVVTTHLISVTGSFSVSAAGPAPVNLVSFTPPTTSSTTSSKFLITTFL